MFLIFSFIENRWFSHILIIVSFFPTSYFPFPQDPFSFEKNKLVWDNNHSWQNKISYNETNTIKFRHGGPRRGDEQAQVSETHCSHNQESHKNANLTAIIFMQRTCVGSVISASVFVSLYASCLVVSEGLVLLVSSIPSGSYILFISFFAGFSELWGEGSDWNILFRLFLYIRSGYGSLHLIPSTARESLSNDY